MKFYAGLDVGGTSGRVKFSAEDKTLIGEYLGEGCAFNTEGYELGREKYRKLMDAALSKYELKVLIVLAYALRQAVLTLRSRKCR